LDKGIKSCVTYVDNEGTTPEVDIFSLEYDM
jgi:hypothetical protein